MAFNQGQEGSNPPQKNGIIELIDPRSKGHFEFISRAHARSSEAGLSKTGKVDFEPASLGADLRLLIEKNNKLRSSALPFMETLHEQIVSTHSMVILTDAAGTIIEALGDDEFLEKAEKVALQPGAQWSEDTKGTNAIGSALIEELPTVVHGPDHFLNVNHFLTCSAAPIFDTNGSPIGVLDVTGDYRSYHRHTMGLVRMSAQMIENHLFNSSFQDAIILQFHSRGEFLGSAVEGAAAFAPDGKFLAANRVAMIQFGMSSNALKMHTFSSLFGMPLSGLIDHYRACNPENLTLCLSNGNQVIARASLGTIGRSRIFNSASLIKNSGDNNMGASLANQSFSSIQSTKTPCTNSKNRHLSSLKYLNTGDSQVKKVIEKVGKVIDKDIPILILGETGTGKEILAQAIHNDSPRSEKPFVAVNCASIPETLIESELFGYEDGAFTGARKKGAQGKIMQANGGTLFLDEIGDMPMSLQARLLRVLQERVVTPLGSQKSYPVNLMVICATHRNLRDQIKEGLFREDLYYRLHGLSVKLPALRDRTDISRIIGRILENVCDNENLIVHPEVMDAFQQYSWPGNIRQLTNILRTASVMACSKEMIEWDDLPDDFVDEWNSRHEVHFAAQVVARQQVEMVRQATPTSPAQDTTRAKPRFSIQAKISGQHPAISRPKFQIQRHVSNGGTSMQSASSLNKFREDRFARQSNTFDRFSQESKTISNPSPVSPASSQPMNLEDMETQAIQEALENCRGNVSAAARMLGISRNTIYRRMNGKN